MPLAIGNIGRQHGILIVLCRAEIEPARGKGGIGIIFSVKHCGIFARTLEKDILIVDKSEITRLTRNGHVGHILMLRVCLFGGDIPYYPFQLARANKPVGVVFAIKITYSFDTVVNSNVSDINVVGLCGSNALEHIKSQKGDNISLKALGRADILCINNNIMPIAVCTHKGCKLIILACGGS